MNHSKYKNPENICKSCNVASDQGGAVSLIQENVSLPIKCKFDIVVFSIEYFHLIQEYFYTTLLYRGICLMLSSFCIYSVFLYKVYLDITITCDNMLTQLIN